MSLKKLTLSVLVLSAFAPTAGAYDFISGGICYNLSSDGKRAIVTYSSLENNSYSGDIDIPATVTYGIEELRVSEIGDFAFFNCHDLKSIEIADNVNIIGVQAFSKCSSLASITIPSKLFSLGDYAFDGCSALTSVSIPAATERIGNGVFQLCSSLTEIQVAPENPLYTSIDGALYSRNKEHLLCVPGDSPVTELVLPDEVIIIDVEAFTPCNNLEKLTMGENLAVVEPTTFANCPALKEFVVDPANTDMKVENSALLSHDGTIMFQYPLGLESENYSVPDGVTLMEAFSLAGARILNLTLPAGLRQINPYVFYNTDRLMSVTVNATTPPRINASDFFPASVTDNAPLLVPKESVTTYSDATGWRLFRKIRAIGSEEDGIENVSAFGSDSTVCVYDLHGRRVYTGRGDGISVDVSGIYIIKTDSGVAKVRL